MRCLGFVRVAIGVLACVAVSWAAEKPVSFTESLGAIVARLHSPDENVRRTAVEGLEHRIASLDPYDRTDFRREAKAFLPSLISLLRHRDPAVVSAAISLVEAIREDALLALDELGRLAMDERGSLAIRWNAAQAMFYVTPETMPVMPLILPQPNAVSRILPGYDSRWVNPMFEAFPNPRSTAISTEAYGIAQVLVLSGHTKSEVPYLLKAASSIYPSEIRTLAVGILGELDCEARAATPALRLLLRDSDKLVRRFAASAILQMEKDPGIVEELANCLRLHGRDREEFLKTARENLERQAQEEIDVIAAITAAPDDFVPNLVRTLVFGRGPERRQAIRLLGKIGTAGRPATSALQNALTDDDLETRRLAADALKHINGEDVFLFEKSAEDGFERGGGNTSSVSAASAAGRRTVCFWGRVRGPRHPRGSDPHGR